MEKTNWIVALVVGALVGFFVGHYSAGGSSPGPTNTLAAKGPTPPNSPNKPNAPPGPDPLFKVPVDDSPIRGNKDAKVTVVEFSDFQCPFCSRAATTVDQIRTKYGDDVRIVYKQNPLPFHNHAALAAEASLAAGDQGKFWEMYDLLFKNQQKLERADLESYGQQIGLDMDKFKASLDGNSHKTQIDKEKAMAAALGATGTPAFFINGHKIVGAQPIDAFSKVIDEQKALAEKTLASGVRPSDLYNNLTARGTTTAPAAAPGNNNQPPAAQAKKVDIAAFDPVRGPTAAPVTIVEWSDFQCPFCSRVEPTIKQIKDTYGDKVKFVWRNQPLPFHPHAMPAAKAAMAANEQGKFWEMHDTLFANQQHLEEADFEKVAADNHLDMSKFKADMDSPKIKDEIDQDMKVGSAVGANGTPAFFINGKSLSGAQPFDAFKAVIDDQLKKADELKSKGVRTEDLYAKLMDLNIASAGAAPSAPSGAPAPDQIVTVDVGDAPVRGKANAPITIVEFSDFQCPFCSRGYTTLNGVEQAYGDKVRVAFKNNPLPFHQNAEPAAEAALAANEQGKFWEMYDQLFTHQNALSRPDFEKYADAIHLDMNKFKAALDSNKFKDKVQSDLKQGQAIGVTGTPTFVINGHKLVGAQPEDAFKKIIDAELAKGTNVAHK